ncbi:sirohydrochlorin chelatase [Sciscionella marina]|uniref:sirohydrochlorin chelatase n=1 Tax=Sciscionella marina TaxID=508770 RepID=UPI00035F486E|nr:sirohydrochlorin chelatase [Sciscionella marina]
MNAPLIAVAHGSRDPRSAATITTLVDTVRARAPWLDVRVAFLELSEPRLPEVLEQLHAEGHRRAVVVPLLLGEAYHATVDVPRIAAEAPLEVSTAPVLGPDRRLETVAWQRLERTGAGETDGIVLAAAGSSFEQANDLVRATARRWSDRLPTVAAFASAGAPKLPEAVETLRAAGTRRIVVASWFLAPGLLPDRIAGQARSCGAPVADPLGVHPSVAAVVLDRYLAATARDTLAA